MMYLNTIETTSNQRGRLFVPPCLEENHRWLLLGRMLGLFARGLVTALMLPFQVLDSVLKGRRAENSFWPRSMASVVILTSGIALWTLSRATYFDGRDRTSAILGYMVTLVAASMINGRLQAQSGSLVHAYATPVGGLQALDLGGHGRHGHDRPEYFGHDHHGRGRHPHESHGHGSHGRWHHGHEPDGHSAQPPGDSRGLPVPAESTGTKATEPAQPTGICIGRCRECAEGICVKSGKPRAGRA